MATIHSFERVALHEPTSSHDTDEATHDVLAALAYEGDVAIDALVARTGIPHDVVAAALASDDLFDVSTLGDELVSVKLTDYGYQLARSAVAEWAA